MLGKGVFSIIGDITLEGALNGVTCYEESISLS